MGNSCYVISHNNQIVPNQIIPNQIIPNNQNTIVPSKYTIIRTELAFKFPHNAKGITYNNDELQFNIIDDINNWITKLYVKNNFTNWIVFNDDISKIFNHAMMSITSGHCKGIITWNSECIGWLCHSVANYPEIFELNNFELNITRINLPEIIYGQSFQYIEMMYNTELLHDIFDQICIMQANIYIEHYTPTFANFYSIIRNKLKSNLQSKILQINSMILHIAKSPKCEIDIWSDIICSYYKNLNWRVKTWKHGNHINKFPDNLYEIKHIRFLIYECHEYQDNSKWGISDASLYCVGDLDRLIPQLKNGGGYFLIDNENITNALNDIILY